MHEHRDHAVWRGRRVDWTTYDTDIDPGVTDLIVPGIMAKQTVYEPLAEEMQALGHRVVTMSHESGSMMCAYEIRDLASTLADKYQQPVRLEPHSLGAIHAAEAIDDDSSDISGVTFIQPAGFTGVHPMYAYKSVQLKQWFTRDRYRHGMQIGRDSVEYAFKGRRELPRTVLKASTKSVIREVQGLPDHIIKLAILFESDPLIRCREVSQGLAEAGVKAVMLDIPTATHNAQYEYAHETAALLHSLYTDLEAA